VTRVASQPICLVGLRCVGKTTLGRRLAERLSIPFVDLDQELEPASESTVGRSAGELLEALGQEAFRKLESTCLERVLNQGGPRIVATGGGVVLSKANRERLRAQSRCLWLSAPAALLVTRAELDPAARPALSFDSPLTELENQSLERADLYAEVSEARFETDCDPERVLAEMIAYL